MRSAVTVDELVRVMAERGNPISRATLRYHCRDRRGLLYGIAYRSGRTWMIPEHAAELFAEFYKPWESLRKETGDARQRPRFPPPPAAIQDQVDPSEGQ